MPSALTSAPYSPEVEPVAIGTTLSIDLIYTELSLQKR
jgi:hypothetical protein